MPVCHNIDREVKCDGAKAERSHRIVIGLNETRILAYVTVIRICLVTKFSRDFIFVKAVGLNKR